jgi:lipid A ethanolaminephosphotransferase
MEALRRALRARRPTVGAEALLLAASVAFAAFYNSAFWTLLIGDLDAGSPGTVALVAALFVVVVCRQFAGLALLVPRRLVKPVLAVLFVCAALASHYMDRYAIFLNK